MLLSLLAVAIWVLVFVRQNQPDEPIAEDPPGTDVTSSATGAPDTEPSASPSPSPSESASAPPAAAAMSIGETFVGENSDTTLLQVRKIRPPEGREPEPGQVWLGIRASTCMHADAAPSGTLRLSSWVAENGQRQRFPGVDSPWDDYPAQQYSASAVQPGSCNVGWLLVPLPEGEHKQVEKVIFRPESTQPAEWTVQL